MYDVSYFYSMISDKRRAANRPLLMPPWSLKEEAILVKWLRGHGPTWLQLEQAQLLLGRSATACRMRWSAERARLLELPPVAEAGDLSDSVQSDSQGQISSALVIPSTAHTGSAGTIN